MAIIDRFRHLLEHKNLPHVLIVLALLLTLPSLWVGWQLDDCWQKMVLTGKREFPGMAGDPLDMFTLTNGNPADTHKLMDAGLLPWWTYEKLRLSFWRPLSALTHWIDYQLYPENSYLMHLHSMLWFAALVAVTIAFYRRMVAPAWVAGLAALLFALEDAHGFSVGWLANRNILLAMFFGVLTLIAYDRWRRDAWKPGAILAPVLLALGLLSAEAAVSTGAYLLAYALTIDTGHWWRRLLRIVPYGVIVVAWRVLYNLQGFGAYGSEFYLDPAREPLRFAAAVLERWPILFTGQLGLPYAVTYGFLSTPAAVLMWLGAVLFTVLVVLVLFPIVRRDRIARFWAVGALLSLIPISATLPNDRLLFFVGLGAMGLVAQFISNLIEKPDYLPGLRSWKISAKALAVFFLAVHVFLAFVILPFSAWSPAMFGLVMKYSTTTAAASESEDCQDLVIVNAPNTYFVGYLPLMSRAMGIDRPKHMRCLAPGFFPVELTRKDERTLVVRPRGGYLIPPGTAMNEAGVLYMHFHPAYLLQHADRAFRADTHQMKTGQRVELTGVTVEVTALTADGRPAEATFRFDKTLEDPSLSWLMWKNSTLEPFTPPPVGGTILLMP